MRVVIKEDFKEKGMSKQDFVRLPKSRFLSKKSCIQKHGRTTQFGQHSPQNSELVYWWWGQRLDRRERDATFRSWRSEELEFRWLGAPEVYYMERKWQEKTCVLSRFFWQWWIWGRKDCWWEDYSFRRLLPWWKQETVRAWVKQWWG